MPAQSPAFPSSLVGLGSGSHVLGIFFPEVKLTVRALALFSLLLDGRETFEQG